MTLADELAPMVRDALGNQRVRFHSPAPDLLQLTAVLAGPGFSKPGTNVLLGRRPADGAFEVYVDEDFFFAGDDPQRRRLFEGPVRNRWRMLRPPEPLAGDVNDVVARVLRWLDSPSTAPVATSVVRGARPLPKVSDPLLDRVGRFSTEDDLLARAVAPTAAQRDVAERIAQIAARPTAPHCPLLFGPGGVGKSALADLAALELLDRGLVDEVFFLAGAEAASGAIFWPQRDDLLRQALAALETMPGALVVVEQFDLLLEHTAVADGLLAARLDRGMKMIAVARGELTPRRLAALGQLARRVEPLALGEPDADELREILDAHLRRRPAAPGREVAAEVLPAIARLSKLRPGANPGAAIALLDALLAQAQWTGARLLGPDDLYHLIPPVPEE